MVPFVDLIRLHSPLEAAFHAALADVLRSGRYHLGPQTEAFEAEFAAHEGAPRGVACGSGSDALVLALRAAGVGPGDAVVTVANSFMATAESIRRTGADVLFADADPHTANLDPTDLARLLAEPGAERVRAVIPVHLYGRPADLDALASTLAGADRSDIALIGDAAQAHGSTGGPGATPLPSAPGAGPAGWTALTCYSFYPAKNLGALGDGGFVAAHDEAHEERLRRLRNHGRATKHGVGELGLNSRFDEIQAAVLRIKLPHLRAWTGQRRAAAAGYRERLADLPGLVLPPDHPGHVYHLFVVQLPGARNRVSQALKSRGIGVGLHYPVPVHAMAPYPSARPLPVSERLCADGLSLPMFPGITDSELDEVADALRGALHRHVA